MQRKKWEKRLRVLVLLALFSAMSILLGKYLAVGTTMMRFSLENLPILLAGICFGPVAGMAVGLTADLVGCMMVAYTINPLVTLGAVAIGGISGVCVRLFPGKSLVFRIACAVFFSHLIGSILFKTLGLAAMYETPFWLTLLWRSLNYLIVGIADGALIIFLLKNKAITRSLVDFGGLRWQRQKEGSGK